MKQKKIVLATFGSRGDVQPMLALSLALRAAGHRAILAGPPEKAGWARELGCPFQPFGSDVTAFLDRMKNAHSIRSAFFFLRYLRNEFAIQFRTLPKIIAGTDLVIGASLAIGLSTLAEAMEIPYRYIAFTPQLLPSGRHPFLACKHQNLPKSMNCLTWRAAREMDRFNLRAMLNGKRRQLGLKPVRDPWLHILGPHVIVASDRAVSRVPPDVTPTFTQTGYMHLNQPHVCLAELEAFLSRGSPPVYAGFGSMPKIDQAGIVPIIVHAARAAGERCVIAKFWDGPSPFAHAKDVFFIAKYPHLKLFPRMAIVIHHGGAGTTACAAASGRPQIIVPHILDQYYWADQVHRAGLGPKPVWRGRLTIRNLAAAIREAGKNREIARRTRSAATAIARTNGLEMTVNALLREVY